MYMTNFKDFLSHFEHCNFQYFKPKKQFEMPFIITCEFNKFHDCEAKNIEVDSFSQNVQKMEAITIYNIIWEYT